MISSMFFFAFRSCDSTRDLTTCLCSLGITSESKALSFQVTSPEFLTEAETECDRTRNEIFLISELALTGVRA